MTLVNCPGLDAYKSVGSTAAMYFFISVYRYLHWSAGMQGFITAVELLSLFH